MSEGPVRQERLTLPAQVESVPAARHFLSYMLGQWGLAALVDAVALAASELLTNAVVHAGTPIEVRLLVAGSLVVSVRDGRPAWPG